MDLESLKGTFILEVFKERTWTKLLNPMGNVYKEIIREFYANAIMEGGSHKLLAEIERVLYHKEVHLRS